MIHDEALNRLRTRRLAQGFIPPAYEDSSIAEVGPTILKLFGVPTNRITLSQEITSTFKPNNIIFFLVDGLGYEMFTQYSEDLPFFRKLTENGEVYPLTSVFPSTTSAALTAFHTGLTPQEHGLPEWNVYFEEFDSIIETLPFRFFWEQNWR